MSYDHYERGFNAFKQGQPVTANPFRRGSKKAADWQIGWYAAQQEQQEKSLAPASRV